jgi:acetoin utilization deacetylase AcuC-like enzyme
VSSELARIAVVVSDQHSIHHVREHGYVESPARIKSILKVLQASPEFTFLPTRHFGEDAVLSVHSRAYVEYFKRVSQQIPDSAPLYPYVFPIRNRLRPPKDMPTRAGYFCVDTFTPISRQAYLAARHAVDCALSAAAELLSGRRLAYALVRPPGHHAESSFFGGFCYFNNAAIAAQYLSPGGRVAMVDLDYHHGNGQQQIFYHRQDVLTISLHGHPSFAYPYFSGFTDEEGEGEGHGFNYNYPLPEQLTGEEYLATLSKAVRRVKRFQPVYLVICLGLDGSKGDPTGTWQFNSKDYYQFGCLLGQLALPTLVVQEGGYKQNILGVAVKSFLLGVRDGMQQQGNEEKTKAASKNPGD